MFELVSESTPSNTSHIGFGKEVSIDEALKASAPLIGEDCITPMGGAQWPTDSVCTSSTSIHIVVSIPSSAKK